MNRSRWWTASHQDAYQHSLNMLLGQPWSTCWNIVVIALTLMLAVLCGLSSHQISVIGSDWNQKTEIAIYLHPELNDAAQQQFLQKVRAFPEVESALLTSPADGLIWLQQQEGMQDMVRYLPSNPLPARIQILPNPSWQTPQAIKRLSKTLQNFSEVSDVIFDADWAERLYVSLGILNRLLRCFILMFALSVTLVIGNSLRLLIHHYEDEIQVLQWIGAPAKFIMRPFLYISIWYGLLASLLASILVETCLLCLRGVLSSFTSVYHLDLTIPFLPVLWILGLVGITIALSWTGARLTLHYYIYRA